MEVIYVFGIINVASVFFGKISKSIIGGQYNYKVKQKAKNKMNDTYIDYDGKIRSVKTNKIVYRERLYNGDYVLKDDKLNIIRNYTKEKSLIPLEKAGWGIVSYFFLSPLYARKATITTARAKMM